MTIINAVTNFIDISTQYAILQAEINKAINKVLQHGQFINGPEVAELEEKLANYVGAKHAIGVSSGTDALLIALMALGIKAGDEVITTPFTFISTAEVIELLGAKTVFVDICPQTYNLDPKLIEEKINNKTKAIIGVSLFGQCADFTSINLIAKKYNIFVIEDGAQSFGATHYNKKSCNLCDIGATSFYPSKPLGCYGDGGACFTNDDEIALAMRQIREHGQERRYLHKRLGINGRLDTLQAAIVLCKLNIFNDEIESRRKKSQYYIELINGINKEFGTNVVAPFVEQFNTSVFGQFAIQVENRTQVIEQMHKKNIATAVHYPVPLNKQPVFQHMQQDCPIAEQVSKNIFSLPFSPYITDAQQLQVIHSLQQSILHS